MRVFIWKLCNLVLICCLLFGYQQYAERRASKVSAYEKEAEAAKEAWAEAERAAGGEEETENTYQDGTYQGSGTGFGGEIAVQVVIQDGSIQTVEILSAENETPDYLDSARALLEDIVKAQSVEVDTVSGATLSSNGILEGAGKALLQAKKARQADN